jgi:hypothetical protein
VGKNGTEGRLEMFVGANAKSDSNHVLTPPCVDIILAASDVEGNFLVVKVRVSKLLAGIFGA